MVKYYSLVLLALTMLFSGCGNQRAEVDELIITDLTKGGGQATVQVGSTITIKEKTSYLGGIVIFHTDSIGGSISFEVGANQVITGLDEGVIGMKEGGIRKITIPPHLSQRSEYPDFIHPDSTLVYVVEVLEITR